MRRAFLYLATGPADRLSAFMAGLRRHGFHVVLNESGRDVKDSDVVVTWNRYGRRAITADAVAAVGGRVIVAENGYCGADAQGYQYIALARDQHLGAGNWFPRPDSSRWRRLGVDLQPWRACGDHVLLCLSRGIGSSNTAMPARWPRDIAKLLGRVTRRPVRVRCHPHDRVTPSTTRLADDLVGAHAVVVWGSNAGTEALIAGVPVFHALANWIMAPAARRGVDDLESPFMGDREAAFVRMSWAQWTLAEIAAGVAFEHLLEAS